MAGFDNDVVYASNVDFSGSASVSGQIQTNGQLLIGTTAVNAGGTHINVGNIVAGTGITVGYSSPNITISASSQTIQTVVVTLTSLQIKSLVATPVLIVPAPGPGLIVYPISIMTKSNYGGTSAFVGNGPITLKYDNSSSNFFVFNVCQNSSDIQFTSTKYAWFPPAQIGVANGPPPANIENTALYVRSRDVSEITGNAANDNTISIRFTYFIAPVLP